MNRKSITSSAGRHRGVTLTEVVAGLALLGSLLVTLLIARLSLTRQRIESEERIAATHACDQLLSAWFTAGKPIPRPASGHTGPDGRFSWRTRATRTEHFESVALQVVRLELADATRRDRKPLAVVEVLTP